jgi:hypothetical protein
MIKAVRHNDMCDPLPRMLLVMVKDDQIASCAQEIFDRPVSWLWLVMEAQKDSLDFMASLMQVVVPFRVEPLVKVTSRQIGTIESPTFGYLLNDVLRVLGRQKTTNFHALGIASITRIW